MWELVDRRADVSPDHPMLMAADGESITFGQFRDRAERVAAGLQAMGITAGSVVSWQLPTRIDTVVLSGALSRLGAVQNPIIHLYREREVGFALRQTGATLFVIPAMWRDIDFAAMAERALEGAPTPPEILAIDDGLPDGDPATLPPPPQGTAPEEAPIRWIYYTSGSTADPKGVQHTDQPGDGHAEHEESDHELKQGEPVLVTPLDHRRVYKVLERGTFTAWSASH